MNISWRRCTRGVHLEPVKVSRPPVARALDGTSERTRAHPLSSILRESFLSSERTNETKRDYRVIAQTGEYESQLFSPLMTFSIQRALTDAGAPVEQEGAVVMETTPALAVVPAGQVDTAGVVVALDQALCTLVDI